LAEPRSDGRGFTPAARDCENAARSRGGADPSFHASPPDVAADRGADPSLAHDSADGDPDAPPADEAADSVADTRRADAAADGGRDPARADRGADRGSYADRVSGASSDGRGFLPRQPDARGLDCPGGAGQAG